MRLSLKREFYDPDTVELMEWINANTAKTAAFTGSMQLLAGVRLSTFRPLTNHPHFEDKELRARTKDVSNVIFVFSFCALKAHLLCQRVCQD